MMLFKPNDTQQHESGSNIPSSDKQYNRFDTEALRSVQPAAAQSTTIERIQSVAAPILHSLGLELFDLALSGSVLRIFIDKKEGVTLDECAAASRHLGTALEVEEVMPEAYTLEVSSPGLDRPLRNQDDYLRFTGRQVKIKTVIPFENQKVFIGRLLKVAAGKVSISLSGGEEIDIPFDQIERARLEVELPGRRNGWTNKGGM